MWFGIVTLFPEMFSPLNYGITGRAAKQGLIQLVYTNPRDFSLNKHRNVDDRPYGGGPGMVMMAEPLQQAIKATQQQAPGRARVIHLSPQGQQFNQAAARDMLAQQQLIFIAGRYEGIDERVLEQEVDETWSIGDYILSGGEIAALAMIDAITRLIPGALGHEDSAAEDSISCGLLKYPQYTRPAMVAGMKVPEVLCNGNQAAILRWRMKQSLGRTWLKRPDLLTRLTLDKDQVSLLMEFIEEHKHGETIEENT